VADLEDLSEDTVVQVRKCLLCGMLLKRGRMEAEFPCACSVRGLLISRPKPSRNVTVQKSKAVISASAAEHLQGVFDLGVFDLCCFLPILISFNICDEHKTVHGAD